MFRTGAYNGLVLAFIATFLGAMIFKPEAGKPLDVNKDQDRWWPLTIIVLVYYLLALVDTLFLIIKKHMHPIDLLSSLMAVAFHLIWVIFTYQDRKPLEKDFYIAAVVKFVVDIIAVILKVILTRPKPEDPGKYALGRASYVASATTVSADIFYLMYVLFLTREWDIIPREDTDWMSIFSWLLVVACALCLVTLCGICLLFKLIKGGCKLQI